MSDVPIIRPLQPGDREAVRRLCGDTADSGEPIERVFSDRVLVVDTLTRYYTDLDPAWSWVADASGQLAGYVLAAPDTPTVERAVQRRVAPWAVARSILHGALFRPETWRMLATLGANRRALASRHSLMATYPAHVHINLNTGFRSQGLGGRLLDTALQQLREARIGGVHASVRADNLHAGRLFESHGFTVVHHSEMTFPVRGGLTHRTVLLYGCLLAS